MFASNRALLNIVVFEQYSVMDGTKRALFEDLSTLLVLEDIFKLAARHT